MGRGEPTAKEPLPSQEEGEKEFKHHLPAALP